MLELEEMERREDLNNDRHKIRNFIKEIEMTDDKNLDESLIDFMDKNDLEINDDIIYWLRQYNKFLKER